MYNPAYRPGGASTPSRDTNPMNDKIRKYVITGTGLFSMFMSFLLFFIPFCTDERRDESLFPIGVMSFESGAIINLAVFLVVLISCAGSLVYFMSSLKSYSKNITKYTAKIQNLIALNALITGVYYAAGVVYCTVRNYKTSRYSCGVSIVPFLLVAAAAILYAFMVRGMDYSEASVYTKKLKSARIEFYIYGAAAALLTIVCALSNVLQVTFVEPDSLDAIKINGFKLLTSYNSQSGGFQLLAFFLLAILMINIGLLLASTVSLISRSKMFYRLTLAEMFFAGVSSLLIGLFGKYYEIVQKLNEEVILSLIGKFIDVDRMNFTYKVQSQAFLWFLVVAGVILVTLIRKPYSRGTMGEADIAVNAFPGGGDGIPGTDSIPDAPLPAKLQSDPCPAFTELDSKVNLYRQQLDAVRMSAFDTPSLPGLVQFVVTYARDSRLHLSYTATDIAAFIAGLGSTKLTILQGMSGTGKTSLPKIFTEAVLGNCDIVEVESSWRDKNELLGYYNEFSRIYTPKKFTQALYKARLNPERLTFIVLDEMNLSRIEYYFSDFLSLMENEEHKREIKLLNIGLFRRAEGRAFPYFGLVDGHTIKIPQNVWFIGTANRDESTFEISDKVYDRAHTMNFNKRAPKISVVRDPIPPRYLSVSELNRLFEDAKARVRFDIETCSVIRDVEELLAPYNISFGNRIANQIETFVRIYAACFTPTDAIISEAVETILLSKVVSKLEFKSIDNKAQLAAEFERLGLNRCSEFILRLNED
ncbi:MAG: hypothetical protein IJX76_00155 [Clostridia bacterium]|nr:hypothetical protein [Clostridia bacterium]